MPDFEILGGPERKARKKSRAEPSEHPNMKKMHTVKKSRQPVDIVSEIQAHDPRSRVWSTT